MLDRLPGERLAAPLAGRIQERSELSPSPRGGVRRGQGPKEQPFTGDFLAQGAECGGAGGGCGHRTHSELCTAPRREGSYAPAPGGTCSAKEAGI